MIKPSTGPVSLSYYAPPSLNPRCLSFELRNIGYLAA